MGVLLEPLGTDEIHLHPGAREAVARTVRTLEGLGHVVDEAPRPISAKDWGVFMVVWSTLAAQMPLSAEQESKLSALATFLRDMGERHSAVDLADAVAGMQSVTRRVSTAWEDFDVILTPTLSGPPLPPSELQLPDPREDLQGQIRFTPWASTWNMLGAPSVALPVHTEKIDGVELPFGAMLSAVQPGQDAMLLSLAAQVEQADPWLPRLEQLWVRG